MNGSGDPLRRGRRRSAGGTLDQWVTAGRQLVDGVAGSRPGSRSQARSGSGRGGEGRSLQGLGRWMEDRLDWFMEGEDDWPEPWQEPRQVQQRPAPPASSQPPQARARSRVETGGEQKPATPAQSRRPLDAISRRAAPLLPPATEEREEWPAADSYEVPRWQRPGAGAAAAEPEARAPQQASKPPRRPLPRSSRSRP
jgi:hypothetical protein